MTVPLASVSGNGVSISVAGLGGSRPPAAGKSFGEVLQQEIRKVDTAVASAQGQDKAYASGSPDVTLADAMVSLEKANIAVSAMVQVRDRVVSAYQQISQMQL